MFGHPVPLVLEAADIGDALQVYNGSAISLGIHIYKQYAVHYKHKILFCQLPTNKHLEIKTEEKNLWTFKYSL
jgi:hypothetical protein